MRNNPKDITFEELVSILEHYGFTVILISDKKHSPLLVRCALGRVAATPQSTKDWDASAPYQEHTALRIE